MGPRKRRSCAAAASQDKAKIENVTNDADQIAASSKRVLRSESSKQKDTENDEKVINSRDEPERKRPARSRAKSATGKDTSKDSPLDEVSNGCVKKQNNEANGTMNTGLHVAKDDGKVATSTDVVQTKDEDKVVTVCFSGAVPVDSLFKGGSDFRVYRDENGRDWDCLLNQSNVAGNNNKFYIIQLLTSESGGGSVYRVWRRWGRIGEGGQSRTDNCPDVEAAKKLFADLFRQKTGNVWLCEKFVRYHGKYDLIERDFTVEETKDEKKEAKSVQIPPSKLSERVQEVISLICDVSRMVSELKFLKYDANRAPLGKLSLNQITLGYAALKAIEDCLEGRKPRTDLELACSEYYTRIPHIFSRSGIELIDTPVKLKQELELLSSLENAEAAVSMFLEECASINPIDKKYEQLSCNIIPIDVDSKEFKIIEKSLLSTHATDAHRFKMQVLDIFEVKKPNEEKCFKDCGNRRLLWHGSRMTNFAGILGKGLRIAPPEAPCTGYMFGKGVYFADVSSKSAQYCYVNHSSSVAFMLLSEVSLGEQHCLTRAEYRLPQLLPKGKNSTHGVGNTKPKTTVDLNGVPIPMGPLVKQDKELLHNSKSALHFNEYIVYSTEQIQMRYLLKLKISV